MTLGSNYQVVLEDDNIMLLKLYFRALQLGKEVYNWPKI